MPNDSEKALVAKAWQVPGADGVGPVTMTVCVSEVRITDADGRYVVLAPQQSADVGAELVDIGDWLAAADFSHHD